MQGRASEHTAFDAGILSLLKLGREWAENEKKNPPLRIFTCNHTHQAFVFWGKEINHSPFCLTFSKPPPRIQLHRLSNQAFIPALLPLHPCTSIIIYTRRRRRRRHCISPPLILQPAIHHHDPRPLPRKAQAPPSPPLVGRNIIKILVRNSSSSERREFRTLIHAAPSKICDLPLFDCLGGDGWFAFAPFPSCSEMVEPAGF